MFQHIHGSRTDRERPQQLDPQRISAVEPWRHDNKFLTTHSKTRSPVLFTSTESGRLQAPRAARLRHERIAWRANSTIGVAVAPPVAKVCACKAFPVTASSV